MAFAVFGRGAARVRRFFVEIRSGIMLGLLDAREQIATDVFKLALKIDSDAVFAAFDMIDADEYGYFDQNGDFAFGYGDADEELDVEVEIQEDEARLAEA